MRAHIAAVTIGVLFGIAACSFLAGCGGSASQPPRSAGRGETGSVAQPRHPTTEPDGLVRENGVPLDGVPDRAVRPSQPEPHEAPPIVRPTQAQPTVAPRDPSLAGGSDGSSPGFAQAESSPALPMVMKGGPREAAPFEPSERTSTAPSYERTEPFATSTPAPSPAPIEPQPAAASRSQAVGLSAGSGRVAARRAVPPAAPAIRPFAAPDAGLTEPREASRPALEASRHAVSAPAPADTSPKSAAPPGEPAGEAVVAGDEPPAEPRASQPVEPTSGEDYKVVTVFYGTDRQALEAVSDRRWTPGDWGYTTAILGSISLALGALVCRLPGSRLLMVLTGAAVLTTAVLGIVTLQAGLRGKVPATTTRTYGNERGELEMGTCEVSIPKNHRVGEIERPSVFRLEFQENPTRHVVVLSVTQQPEDEFFAALRARVDRSARKEVLVFVHGFNVTFEAAAQRTAQLAHDLQFDGAPVFFSWPSQGGLLRYAVDETNVAWSTPHLKEFLLAVARRSGAKSVNLIAHSMGNRALTAALHALSYRLKDEPPLFREVVLTAPDIDADVFKRDIAPAIVKTASRVTLYASSNDEALRVSREIHGYPRAGDSGRNVVVMPGMDTIDVSTVDTSLIGHSYYGSNDTVLGDLIDLINQSKPPHERRWLRPVRAGELSYWVFDSPRCRTDTSRQPEDTSRH